MVITSSFAAIVNPDKGLWPEHTYTEADWSPLTTIDAALKDQATGYRGSKAMAEKTAWEFLEKEKPNFTIATMNPPLVFGPTIPWLNSLDAVNTSNQSVRNMLKGDFKGKDIPPSNVVLWVDVRDLAKAHVEAMERAEAANKRFFVTAGYFNNREVVGVIRKNFPEYKDVLPAEDAKGGEMPEKVYGYDNSRTKEVLDVKFRSIGESVVDLVKSLKAAGA